MRFIGGFTGGTSLSRDRRRPSKPSSVSEEEVKDTGRLAEIIRQLSARVQELEAKAPMEAMEKEFTQVPNNAVLTIEHRFGCPVRWYPTFLGAAYNVSSGARGPEPNGPISFRIVQASTSSDVLTLQALTTSVNDYHVVIRVEPSFYGVKL